MKERIATSLGDSIAVNQTRYRHAHDQEGEFWITSGSDRIFSAGSASYLSTLGKLAAENRSLGSSPAQAYEQAWPVMNAFRSIPHDIATKARDLSAKQHVSVTKSVENAALLHEIHVQ
ncbi:MAG TPA: hypothetical protein VF861_08615 [Telluria sp.]